MGLSDRPSSWPSAARWAAGPRDMSRLPWFLFILRKTASLTSRPGKAECLLHSDREITKVPCSVLCCTQARAYKHKSKGTDGNSAPPGPPSNPVQGGWNQTAFSDEKTKAWAWAVTCPGSARGRDSNLSVPFFSNCVLVHL